MSLSCSGLPAGASCQFQPSASVAPTNGNPISVAVSISTSASTPTGTSTIAINAVTPGGSAKTQNLTLVVGSAPDYDLSIANPILTSSVNAPVVFNGELTASNGYSSSVAVSCGAGAPPTCSVAPSNIIPSSAGTPFAVTASSSVSQAYSFSIVGVGSDAATTIHYVPVNFSALPGQSFDSQ